MSYIAILKSFQISSILTMLKLNHLTRLRSFTYAKIQIVPDKTQCKRSHLQDAGNVCLQTKYFQIYFPEVLVAENYLNDIKTKPLQILR